MSAWDFLIVITAALYLAEIMSRPALKGPFGLLSWLRARKKTGALFSCPYCLAPYLGLVLAALYLKRPELVWPFAIAGAMLALRSYSGVAHG